MIPSSETATTILVHLLEIGVYAMVIFGAILAFRRIFHNKTRPALRFGLWFLLLLRLTVPFTVNSGVHLIVLPVTETTAATATARTAASAQPIRPETVTTTPARSTNAPSTTTASPEKTQEMRTSAMRLSIWHWLLILWGVVAAVFLVHRMWMQGLLAARIRSCAKTPDPEIAEEFR